MMAILCIASPWNISAALALWAAGRVEAGRINCCKYKQKYNFCCLAHTHRLAHINTYRNVFMACQHVRDILQPNRGAIEGRRLGGVAGTTLLFIC